MQIENYIRSLGHSPLSVGIYNEASNTVAYLEDSVTGFRVDSVSGRGDSSINITETVIGNSGGAKYRRKRDESKNIQVSFNLACQDSMDLQKSISLLRKYLDDEDVKWVFYDEPNVFWQGTVSEVSTSTINANGSGVSAVSGSFTIHCSRPYKYSITNTIVKSSTNTFADQVTLVNSGSIPVPLNIETVMKSTSSYLGFTLDSPKGSQYYMFGTPTKVESNTTVTDDQIDLINIGFSTQPSGWIVNAGVLPPIGSLQLTQSGDWKFDRDGYWDQKPGSNKSVEVGLSSNVVHNWDGSNNGMYSSARITEQSQDIQNGTTTIAYSASANYYCSQGYWWGGSTRNDAGYLDVCINNTVVDTITLKVVNGWVDGTSIGSVSGTRVYKHDGNGALNLSLKLVCRRGTDPLNGGVIYENNSSGSSTLICTPIRKGSSILPNGQEEGYAWPKNYGDGSGWHGPTLSKMITATNGTYPTNWRLSYRFDFNNDGLPTDSNGNTQYGLAYGIQSVVVADRSGSPIVSIVYMDNDATEYSEFDVYVGRTKYTIGGSSDKNQFHVCGTVSRNMAALVVEKVGTDLHVSFKYPQPSEYYKALNIDKHFSIPNKDTEVGSITFYAAKYGNDNSHLAVNNNLLRYLQFTKLKSEAKTSNEISCVFHNNDIITIDNDTNTVQINGVTNWGYVDVASDVLMLYPGPHTLKYIANAESSEASPEVKVMYREGWK